jgi:hypothetical protein
MLLAPLLSLASADFLVIGVFSVPGTILLQLEAACGVLAVLGGGVISPLALLACQGDDYPILLLLLTHFRVPPS